MSYDQWKQTDTLADEMATYDARHAALAARIRIELIMSDYLSEIEVDASFDVKCCQAISRAFLGGVNPAIVLHNYALDWLDAHADKMAVAQLLGGDL